MVFPFAVRSQWEVATKACGFSATAWSCWRYSPADHGAEETHDELGKAAGSAGVTASGLSSAPGFPDAVSSARQWFVHLVHRSSVGVDVLVLKDFKMCRCSQYA